MRFINSLTILTMLALLLTSCNRKGGGEVDEYTGWTFNDQDWGGFERLDYDGQVSAPNMVLVEGGTFTMGQTEEDVSYEWNNIPRRVTVSSFYMDEEEVSNQGYRFYTEWLNRRYVSYPEVYRDALPDTLVWREELSYNEPFVETYFRHPAYNDYPVVGVSWIQAQKYCQWRTDRANEAILIKKGILNNSPEQKDSEVFTTDAYLAGQYEGNVRKNLEDKATGGERQVRFEDGILTPDYRLPTEAEWEYAALGLQGNAVSSKDELISDRRIFPWNGNSARYQRRNKQQGDFQANFKRGRGDYMGVAGNLNDRAHIPGPVKAYLPNDFGLYNMAGNVSEWCEDLYRPLTSSTLRDSENHDLNPFRGNRFEEIIRDEDGRPVEKDSLGQLRKRYVVDSLVYDRENYKRGDVMDYRDGDNEEYVQYEYGKSTLINNKSRVIKGGSWADRLYWLSPGARRYKSEDKSDRTLGFRCAVTRVGGPDGNEDAGGNFFKAKGRRR